MEIRKFQATDIDQILALFYNTVCIINRKDYSQVQLEAWAPKTPDRTKWLNNLTKYNTYVAEIDQKIIGFGDVDHAGFIDHLYTHADFQGKGIASAILKKLEEEAIELNVKILTTEASITAKPFFEKHGFVVDKINAKLHRGVEFTTYDMHKDIVIARLVAT